MDQKELQEKYIAFQTIDQQIQQIEKQITAFDEHLSELASIQEALDEIKKVKPGTEMLVPVSQGIFIKTVMKDPNSLVVNVGGKATVEKDVEGTKKLIDSQLTDIEDARADALRTLEAVSIKAQELQEELANAVRS